VSSFAAQDAPTLPGEVMPLVGYSPFWLLVGIALIVLVLVYYVLAWAFTRERGERVEATPEHEVDLADERRTAFARLDEIEQAVAAGRLDDRTAYEHLSVTVREFVAEATGVPADHMTLTELATTELYGTTRTVAQLYPGIFARDAQRNVAAATHDARQVISGWN
jgi:hypothetical protein